MWLHALHYLGWWTWLSHAAERDLIGSYNPMDAFVPKSWGQTVVHCGAINARRVLRDVLDMIQYHGQLY